MIMQRLSLLARGTRLHAKIPVVGARFIPAGEGNTDSTATGQAATAVYPRWRGEHVAGLSTDRIFFGLSPLARGTLPLRMAGMLLWRFIPAGAGNTSNMETPLMRATVYPRWRGEHSGTRGGRAWCLRFIPAGAGNTLPFPEFRPLNWVYPRWRGEH
ncbi:Domain of uncharacterised function (DUF2825) [Salmonella enterica subsp. enterica serovar Gallinarum]|nr:Domain of uncharacterised function (DUF2825) [Salmonella enterica subsp. enterica serovar Gallinarum]